MRPFRFALPVGVLLTLAVPALGAVLKYKARLREGPTKESTLIDWVDTGTSVSVIGQAAGWYHVVLPDGRQGFIWGDHLDQIEAPAPGDEAAGDRKGEKPSSIELRRGLSDEVHGEGDADHAHRGEHRGALCDAPVGSQPGGDRIP